MNYSYLVLVAFGLILLAWGLPAAHRLSRPWHILAALGAILGLVLTILGTLLCVIPNFFKG